MLNNMVPSDTLRIEKEQSYRAGQIHTLKWCLVLVQDYPEEFAIIDKEIIKLEAENAR